MGGRNRVKEMFSITKPFFFTVGQNNFGNKIPFFSIFTRPRSDIEVKNKLSDFEIHMIARANC